MTKVGSFVIQTIRTYVCMYAVRSIVQFNTQDDICTTQASVRGQLLTNKSFIRVVVCVRAQDR